MHVYVHECVTVMSADTCHGLQTDLVCMRAHMIMYVCVCILYVCHIYFCMQIPSGLCMCMCVCVYIYMHIHTNIYIYIYIYICICIYIYIYIYIHTHTHIEQVQLLAYTSVSVWNAVRRRVSSEEMQRPVFLKSPLCSGFT
jgi:hypothetical protein